jgi:hypothetical protein
MFYGGPLFRGDAAARRLSKPVSALPLRPVVQSFIEEARLVAVEMAEGESLIRTSSTS